MGKRQGSAGELRRRRRRRDRDDRSFLRARGLFEGFAESSSYPQWKDPRATSCSYFHSNCEHRVFEGRFTFYASNYISATGNGEGGKRKGKEKRGDGRDAIRQSLRPTVSANAITQLNFQFSQTNAITSSNSVLLFSNRPPTGVFETKLRWKGSPSPAKEARKEEFNRNFAALFDQNGENMATTTRPE